MSNFFLVKAFLIIGVLYQSFTLFITLYYNSVLVSYKGIVQYISKPQRK